MLSKEKSLVDYLNKRLADKGFIDISITNIRVFANGNLIADVSYTWKLNAEEERVGYKNIVFIYKDEEWYSPLFV